MKKIIIGVGILLGIILSSCQIKETNTITTENIDLSYQDVIDFVSENITEIITSYSTISPANGKWFADGFGFVDINHVYVDYEDGHYLYRALLECSASNDIIICSPQAIFEKEKGGWVVIQGIDAQKDKGIIHKWAIDYQWER